MAKQAYHGEEMGEEEGWGERVERGEDTRIHPKNVGHNIYLLAHQVSYNMPSCRSILHVLWELNDEFYYFWNRNEIS